MRARLAGIGGVLAVLIVLVVLYFGDFLTSAPPALSATTQNGTTRLTLQTVASFGHAPAPDWVSYLAQDSGGRWQFGLVCDYEDHEHLQSYYSTPEHAAVVEEIVPLIADRAVCDFEL